MLEESLRVAVTDSAQLNFYSAFRASIECCIQAALPTGLLQASESAYLRRADHNTRLVDGTYSEADFAAGYGFGTKTVAALNYLDGDLSHLNSLLPFRLRPRFSIGSFIFEVSNHGEEFIVETDGSFWLAAYGFSRSPKGHKRFFCLYDVRPTVTAISRIQISQSDSLHLDSLHPCSCPPTWIDRSSGRVFTCTCFDIVVPPSASSVSGYFPTIRSDQLPRLEIKPGLSRGLGVRHLHPLDASRD
jgi:hypothetical protein